MKTPESDIPDQGFFGDTHMYKAKSPDYFSSIRYEIEPLLPVLCDRALEVGCGEGGTLGWAKQNGRVKHATGIELMGDYAEISKGILDHVITANIESDEIILEAPFQLILCLDVLEHLRDPWQVMGRLVSWLAPGGVLIASLPNVRYLAILTDLVLRGRFDYQDSGILDRTHLRFFTRHSAVELFRTCGLNEVRVVLHPGSVRGKARLLNILTLGALRDMFAWQILISGMKPVGVDGAR